MPVATAVGSIVAALLAGGSSLLSMGLQNKATQEASDEARKLSERFRRDELDRQTRQEEQAESQFSRRLGFEQEQAALGRAERTEERSYKRKQDVYKNALGIINNNLGLRDRMAQLWGGK